MPRQQLTTVGPGTVRLARIAAATFSVGMAAFAAIPLAEVLERLSGVRGAVGVVLITALTGCYLWLGVRAVLGRNARWDLWVLGAMTALNVAVPFAGGPSWLSLGFMLPFAFAVTLAGRRAWWGFFAAIALNLALAVPQELNWVLFSGLQSLLTAAALAGLTIFATLLSELHRTREELARLAITEERLRFARELHDVLGHNLSVIAMRTELSMRIPSGQRSRLHGELTEIHDIARRSLHDVRAVVKGYREMSLEKELTGVRKVLESAGVKCDFADLPSSVSAEVRVALAWAVREAATNLLRHSDATVCLLGVESEDDRIRVTVSNDGVRQGGATTARAAGAEATVGGSGLAGLDERLAQVGGTCDRHLEDGWFTLSLDVPSRALAASLTSATGERK